MPELVTLNRVYRTELGYIKEHTSRVNHKTGRYSGLLLGQALTGESFGNQKQEIKVSHLIFILSGEVEVIRGENEKAGMYANEFMFIPISSHCIGKVTLPGGYTSLTFFHSNISLCDKHVLSGHLKEESDVPLYFETLSIKGPLNLFFDLLGTYPQADVSCKHLHEVKERELFTIFRTTYTRRETIRLSHPIMGKKFDLKIAVLQHKDQVYSKEELAQLLGMSNFDLQRKFIQEFGEPVPVWLQKQKNQKMLSRLSYDPTPIKEVAHELGFLSASSFNEYCKCNFGYNPTELKKQIKER